VNRVNADLANDLGNLAQRSLSMIAKNCDGKMPSPGEFAAQDKEILAAVDALLPQCREHHEVQALHKSLDAIWKVVADANRYFAGQEPWALKKTDPERMATVLYVTAEVIRQVAILAQPYMPASASKLLDLLVVPDDAREFEHLAEAGRLPSGTELPKPEGVFPRYVEDEQA
ncbi:MAG: methionine--tRNA ligase, partial [Pseudomonadota bacterium]